MNALRKIAIITLLGTLMMTAPPPPEVRANPIVKIIKEAIKKALKALDLMVQRIQSKTIGLQNIQKELENLLSKLKLKEIAEWTDKHRQLYQQYYDELWKVKNTIATYKRVRQILDKQVKLVNDYHRAWSIVQQDKHFTPKEIDYMYQVYSGILSQSMRNLDEINLVIKALETQMSDARRLEIINRAGAKVDQNYADLRQFNEQNMQLSIGRAKDHDEIEAIRKLYRF
jgi:hypothetical protein